MTTFAMSYFLLPKTLCDDLTSMINKFWWGSGLDRNPIYWKCWEEICRKKSEGELGLRDLEAFNFALLAKQGRRLVQHPNSLVARVLQGLYFRNSSVLETKLGSRPSYLWRSILEGHQLLQMGLR